MGRYDPSDQKRRLVEPLLPKAGKAKRGIRPGILEEPAQRPPHSLHLTPGI